MPQGSRTGVRSVLLLTIALGALVPALRANPILPKSGAIPPPPGGYPDSLPDTSLYIRDKIVNYGDTVAGGPATPGARDSLHRETAQPQVPDSLRPSPPHYAWTAPEADVRECPAGAESGLDCWRSLPDLANQGIGFAGPRAWSLSLTDWRPLPQESPYNPFWRHSPYRSGGLEPPQRYTPDRIGGDLIGLREAWSPVAPLDTPITQLDWMRGALSLNVFDFRLERMLSDRVYLGLDYYSATADSQTYDYQFNVHQPYLGGWGFLGKIYAPIDRDSASLVLGGVSHAIHALEMRPRIGYWIDTNRVVEFFLDRMRNGSSLTFPYGPSRPPGALIPSGPDSMQALMPSSLETLTEGALYGETHADWTGRLELGHGAFDLEEYRKTGDASSPDREKIHADEFRARGTLAATRLFARPALTAEARSGTWSGDPLLGMAAGVSTEGWTDAQDVDIEASPEWAFLELKARAGIGRDSRMDNQVYWLPRYGASARLTAPFGFAAEASLSSRAVDPDWELLYRTNPARFRFANPDLKPRTDGTWRGALSWAWSRLSVEAGFDRLAMDDAWLPRVLPSPEACAALADSAYGPLVGTACGDPATATAATAVTAGAIGDSLALALRNYASETVDAWHLGLGLGLGHWTLDVQNRFVLDRSVEDPDLKGILMDRSVPERVFKGRLDWKRNLLDDRLKLDFAWDWEWFSTRYAWVPDLEGQSRVVKLDEYLALDFSAAMKIKTFTLFFKARNFNHDRYATEPGVHPPGLNFRFGVDWTLFN